MFISNIFRESGEIEMGQNQKLSGRDLWVSRQYAKKHKCDLGEEFTAQEQFLLLPPWFNIHWCDVTNQNLNF